MIGEKQSTSNIINRENKYTWIGDKIMGNKYQDIRFKWLEEKGFNVLADKHQYAYVQSLWAPVDVVQAVFCESPAGTGKTSVAVMCGAYAVENGDYDRIIYIRNTEVVGKEVGFLPGTVDEKIGAHMLPFVEALDGVKPGTFESWVESGRAQATTATFLRGVTFRRAFIIIDEAQSLTLEELQTIYTRVTDDCKIVTTGSLRQIDNLKLKRIAGLTPFEVYMKHFEGTPATYHKLTKNYRGAFSLHSDRIQKTVKDLLGIPYDLSDFEDEE